MFHVLFVAISVAVSLSPAAAQDTVTIAAGGTGRAAKYNGRIVDYTGRKLDLEMAGGVVRSFPAETVAHVATQYGRQHTAADEALADARFDQALALYRQAGTEESRRWVRRQIMARVVWCYRALDQPDQAGAWFLLLAEADPSTQYFDCIPLAWMPRQPAPAVDQAARQWIQRDEPAAVLLGASHLLTGEARLRGLAADKLRRLVASPDKRIALLARAQTWRTAMAGTGAQLDAWSRVIEQMPQELAAGPYFVLGRARMQQQQWEPAALALLRVPILHPNHRGLAAQSLMDAGRCLQRLGRTAEAVRLYRELIGTHPNTPPAAEARSRIEEIVQK